MNAKFKVGPDLYQIDQLAGPGKRLKLNGQKVYEGKMTADDPARFSAGGCEFEIAKVGGNYQIHKSDGGKTIIQGTYNGGGVDINDRVAVKLQKRRLIFTFIGAVVGGGLVAITLRLLGIQLGAIPNLVVCAVVGVIAGAVGKLFAG